MANQDILHLSARNQGGILKMDKLPFADVYQVLNHYLYCKPGRIKPLDIDQEIRAREDGINLKWEMCVFAIQRGVEKASLQKRRAFWLRYAKQWPAHLTVAEIMRAIGITLHAAPRTLYTWIYEILDNIEREAIDMRLIPPRDLH